MNIAKKIHFGVDYYPEHWPQERWETDARLMQEMGLKTVRLSEFSWHKLEPEEGRYDFEWLDQAVRLMEKYGITVIMGTPSAAPPAWMVHKHPDILPIDRQGRVRGFGGRHHDCQSNPVYREYIRKLVTQMAGRYGKNKNVIGWQPDNELGNSHHDLCTCGHCRKNFQVWLQKKYGTVEELNRAWGNAFWSQEYNDFEEIPAPRITVTGENPSAMLDWSCCCSDLVVDFMKLQTDIIREYCPGQFITHNYMGFADKVDYYDLGKELDFVSHDQYPGGFFLPGDHDKNHVLAATLDVVRSYKNMPFWVMEQQSGITGWEMMGRAPAPGQLSMWAMQSVAHGADAIVFFRWRVCAMGTEQYWHGILPHSGNPGRRYEELKKLIGRVTPVMEEIQGSMPNSQTGIVFSFRQNYALKIQPHHQDLSYVGQVQKYYKALYDRQVPVDFVPEDGDFSKYRLLIAPLQYLMTPQLEEKYFEYVKNGGRLILTMRCGVKDKDNLCMTDRELPGRLSELAGIEVLDYDCLQYASIKTVMDGKEYDSYIWSDLMQLKEETQTVAVYGGEFYRGEPCVTMHAYGKGDCFYVGTEPGEEMMAALMGKFLEETGIKALGKAEPDVELCAREKDGRRYLFALNHTAETKIYRPEGAYHPVFMGDNGEMGVLKPYEVHILEDQI